jgi:ribonucleoside-diphosphate reductase alpha chain
MQIAQQGTAAANAIAGAISEPSSTAQRSPFADYKIIRRNGAVVGFEPSQDLGGDDPGLPRGRRRRGAASARIRSWWSNSPAAW